MGSNNFHYGFKIQNERKPFVHPRATVMPEPLFEMNFPEQKLHGRLKIAHWTIHSLSVDSVFSILLTANSHNGSSIREVNQNGVNNCLAIKCWDVWKRKALKARTPLTASLSYTTHCLLQWHAGSRGPLLRSLIELRQSVHWSRFSYLLQHDQLIPSINLPADDCFGELRIPSRLSVNMHYTSQPFQSVCNSCQFGILNLTVWFFRPNL